MKKIAITQRLIDNQSYKETREALDVNYAKLVNAAGFLPITLPYEVDFSEYFQELDISGVLLTGGNDLNSINPNPLSEQRDKYEKEVITHAISNNIPIFGICRGLQIIAEHFDSTFKEVPNQVNVRHDLKVNQKSLYARQLSSMDEVIRFIILPLMIQEKG